MFVEKLNKEHIRLIMNVLCPEEEFNNRDYESVKITQKSNRHTQNFITVKVSLVKNAFVMYDNRCETLFKVEDEENLQENYKKLMLGFFGEEYKNYLEKTNDNELEY